LQKRLKVDSSLVKSTLLNFEWVPHLFSKNLSKVVALPSTIVIPILIGHTLKVTTYNQNGGHAALKPATINAFFNQLV
jgi:hypothetical protein